jgi:hypothetical protein
MLESLITFKTRLRLLVKFFVNVANEGYLRGLAGEMNENTNAIRKELNNLSEAGYITQHEDQGKITYKANQEHTMFVLLQKLVRKYVGLDTIVERILERTGEVQRVIVTGDYAAGIDSGTVELTIEGKERNEQYIKGLTEKLEQERHKTVTITLTEHHQGKGLTVFQAA